MSKKILVIENDGAVAGQIASVLAARGCEAQVNADGHDALEQARAARPDLIVLSVELPGTSGYSICNKLKKDEALRKIPLLITSAEATPETFEQHRKLKTHADDYLLKPFDPGALLQHVAGLIDLPAGPDGAVDDFDLDEIGAEVVETPGDATAGVPHAAAAGPGVALDDDDLKLLDQVFDELAASGGDVTPLAETLPASAQDAPAASPPPAAAVADRVPDDGDALRTRVAELTAELERTARALRDAETAHGQRVAALENDLHATREATQAASRRVEAAEARAAAADARAVAAEARLRRDDAVREKTRKALALALQLLEEPAARPSPGEVPPRRE